ncbi:MAG: RNA polymerase sigma factor [Sedimentisphaerales bacterium]|nr:RNA polymerase sigma factor [Sedimentisphaerales bacterium]
MTVVNGKMIQLSQCAAGLSARECERATAAPAGDLMAVVSRHQGPLLRYVGRMLGGVGDQREDVVQETFIRLHRQVSTHGWDSIKHLTPWLFQVAHNLTLDALRQKVRRKDADPAVTNPAVAPEPTAEEMDALGEAIRKEARQVVLRELAQLDDTYRQVVLLKVVQDMSLREVAEVVGVSLSTVNYRLNEALGILARRLRKAGVV